MKASSTISTVSHSSSQDTLTSMSISDPSNNMNRSSFQRSDSSPWTVPGILDKGSGLNLVSSSPFSLAPEDEKSKTGANLSNDFASLLGIQLPNSEKSLANSYKQGPKGPPLGFTLSTTNQMVNNTHEGSSGQLLGDILTSAASSLQATISSSTTPTSHVGSLYYPVGLRPQKLCYLFGNFFKLVDYTDSKFFFF